VVLELNAHAVVAGITPLSFGNLGIAKKSKKNTGHKTAPWTLIMATAIKTCQAQNFDVKGAIVDQIA